MEQPEPGFDARDIPYILVMLFLAVAVAFYAWDGAIAPAIRWLMNAV